MATSESDDFESADEELASGCRSSSKKNPPYRIPSVVDSDSDGDPEMQHAHNNVVHSTARNAEENKDSFDTCANSMQNVTRKERIPRQRKPRAGSSLGAKKLGTKIAMKETEVKSEKLKEKETDMEMPEELKSNLKFKDVFKYEGWEGLEDDKVFSEQLTEEKLGPVLDRIALSKNSPENAGASSWGGWGGWGVTSLMNTASAGVSTLTNHMSQSLTLFEESMGAPDPVELAKKETVQTDQSASNEPIMKNSEENSPQSLFDFSNLMFGVSSITKLVESTGTKVISGGLGTLEVIGKKTMEVLQEGDPGLKKKRAFFLNEADKPNLSHILREAKERADKEEKSLEEKQLARKIHFESLFDDYQGLVHLEALEMLSKQSSMKIEQQLINLDGDDLISMQETLEEIKELCDLGDEDEEEQSDKDLKERLNDSCKDLGVLVNYDKLYEVNEEVKFYISSEKSEETVTHRQIFQQAISALAQFTAYSVERFHKTAELILVKERRSTVNEADALVQLAHILCGQIGIIANSFCDRMNEFKDDNIKSNVNSSITTIFLEAANASSYIQDAFKLLIPILQVGAI